MDFDDTADQASFPARAREWLEVQATAKGRPDDVSTGYLEVLGPAGAPVGDGFGNGDRQARFPHVPASGIAGGSDEIQRNIVGQRVPGLPREPRVGHVVAFRDQSRAPR